MHSRQHGAMSAPAGQHLIARKTSWTDGEVVTVLIGVALELAALHAVGQTYGSLHPVHVGVDSRGRPHLRRVEATCEWSEADDVRAVVRLGWSLSSPGRLQGMLTSCARSDVQTIDALTAWLLRVCAPERIRLDA